MAAAVVTAVVCSGTLIQTPIDGAGDMDTIYVHVGAYITRMWIW